MFCLPSLRCSAASGGNYGSMIRSPRKTQASHWGGSDLIFYFAPPTLPAGWWSVLTTGWHQDGISLDWDDENLNYGNTAYLRGWGGWIYPGYAAYALAYHHTLYNCQNSLRLDIYDNFKNYAGTLWMVHTSPLSPYWYSYLNFGPNWPGTTWRLATRAPIHASPRAAMATKLTEASATGVG